MNGLDKSCGRLANSYETLGTYPALDPLMEISLAIKFGVTVKQLVSSFHPYLTLSEGVKLAAITFERDVGKLSCCAV